MDTTYRCYAAYRGHGGYPHHARTVLLFAALLLVLAHASAAVINYSDYEGFGNTTDLSQYDLAQDASVSLVLDMPGTGMIEYMTNVTLNDSYNLNDAFDIGAGYVYVDTVNYPTLNVTANLTMPSLTGVSWPRLYKDGADCADCAILSWDSVADLLVVQAGSFSNISAGENGTVIWHNPNSDEPLFLENGTYFVNDSFGYRSIHANGTNTDVTLACVSGACAIVLTNWSVLTLSDDAVADAWFNCSGVYPGAYAALYSLTSVEMGYYDNLSVNCNLLAVDLALYNANISFSSNAGVEGDNITLTASIVNLGFIDAQNVPVSFYLGNESLFQVLDNYTVASIPAGSTYDANSTFLAAIGTSNFTVIVDAPLDTNGTISESDEYNNYAQGSYSISIWQYFIGNITGNLVLAGADNVSVVNWEVANVTDSVILIADLESTPSFGYLRAMTKNTVDAFGYGDFDDADLILNITNTTDSLNISFIDAALGIPFQTANYTIFGHQVIDVPTINNTQISPFRTGILWDAADDSGDGVYDIIDHEDIVFVSLALTEATSDYGVYDFEIKIPATLRNYLTADTGSVSLYVELR